MKRRIVVFLLCCILGFSGSMLYIQDDIGNSFAATELDFQQVVGRWVRADGVYTIEIDSVDDNGEAVAKYFNPRPINVGRAIVSELKGHIMVRVSLNDINYPGSMYTLTYFPEKDILVGIYFQAMQGKKHRIFFKREEGEAKKEIETDDNSL